MRTLRSLSENICERVNWFKLREWILDMLIK